MRIYHGNSGSTNYRGAIVKRINPFKLRITRVYSGECLNMDRFPSERTIIFA